MDSIRVLRCPDLSPEQARDIRARAWAYVFDCYFKKKAGVPSTGGDGKEIRNVPANPIVPERR